MNNKDQIPVLFSKYGTLAVRISGRERDAHEATVIVGEERFSIPITKTWGFSFEIKKLREFLETKVTGRIQTRFNGPGDIIMKILSD
jgi:hypothetical protein